MAHFAKIQNGLVTRVIVAEPEFFETFIDSTPGEWIQTSYNTRGGIHYDPVTGEPSGDQSKSLRKNFAVVGYIYDNHLDAFIAPKPYNTWVLNQETGCWEAPLPYPQDDNKYVWDEDKLSWILV
jgi:hypothetical protein